MADARQRLIRCFSAVFPSLTEDQIQSAGFEEFDSWDSIDLVSLFAVVGEEFNLDPESFVDESDSFESMLTLVSK